MTDMTLNIFVVSDSARPLMDDEAAICEHTLYYRKTNLKQ